MTRRGVEIVLQYGSGVRDPLGSPHDWYVLIELSSQQADTARTVLEEILERGMERGHLAGAERGQG